MERRDLTFRVFVSSTFSDLKAERDALQKEVFTRLREYCQKQGVRFQAIDLRWGVSEEAALDQQTMNICLEELRRCQRTSPRPNFIVLLGQRYGWCPLPPQITATEFEPIRDQIINATDRALLEHWYRRDDNAIPPEYCLQPRQIDVCEDQSEPGKEMVREAEARDWGKTEQRLRAILLSGVDRLVWPLADERRLKYEASATHQEILCGALRAKDTVDHVFGFFRAIEGLPQDIRARDYLDLDLEGRPDAEARRRLGQLQAEMRTRLPNNIFTYSTNWTGFGPSEDHLQRLCVDVYDRLRKVIDEEIQRRDRFDPVNQEAIAHQTFGQERARVFIGRQDALRRIQQYLDGQDRRPLVVHGESGSGKSALLAKAVADRKSVAANDDVICRYIGATPASSDIRSLLEGLCKEITLRYGGNASKVPQEYSELVAEFPNRLAQATAMEPLVLFLDALDQLSDTDYTKSLAWLPAQLPEHVRLVVSTLPGEYLTTLERKLTGRVSHVAGASMTASRTTAPFLEVTPMNAQECAEVLTAWLYEAHRTLQPHERDEMLTKFRGCPYPLYLKLAFEEARRWKSSSPVAQVSRPVALSPDIPGILNDVFTRLEAERNHGRMLVSRALGFLAASRYGLTEDELLDVLSADKEVMGDFRRRSPKSPTLERLPVVVWARLFADIEPYMTQRQVDGTTVLTFYHRQVGEVARERCLAGESMELAAHRALAACFRQKTDPNGEGLWHGVYPRGLRELPYHLTLAREWIQASKILSDVGYLEATATQVNVQTVLEDHRRRTVHAGLFDLLEHYRRWIDAVDNLRAGPAVHFATHEPSPQLLEMHREMLQAFSRCLAIESPLVLENPSAIFQVLWNRLSLAPELSEFIRDRLTTIRGQFEQSGRPWLRRLTRLTGDLELLRYGGHRGEPRAVCFSPDGARILSADDRGHCIVWDSHSGREFCAFESEFWTADHARLEFSTNGQLMLLTNSLRTEIRSAEDGLLVCAVESGHGLLLPDGVTFATQDGKVWQLANGKPLGSLRGDWAGRIPIGSSSDRTQLFAIDARWFTSRPGPKVDRRIVVISLVSGERVDDFLFPFEMVAMAMGLTAIGFSAQGDTCVASIWPMTVILTRSGSHCSLLHDRIGMVSCASFSPNGSEITLACENGMCLVISSDGGRVLQAHQLHSSRVKCLAHDPDGTRMVSGSYGVLTVWQKPPSHVQLGITTDQPQYLFPAMSIGSIAIGMRPPIHNVADPCTIFVSISRDGVRLVAAGRYSEPGSWDELQVVGGLVARRTAEGQWLSDQFWPCKTIEGSITQGPIPWPREAVGHLVISEEYPQVTTRDGQYRLMVGDGEHHAYYSCYLYRTTDSLPLAQYSDRGTSFWCACAGPHPRQVLLGDGKGQIHLLEIEEPRDRVRHREGY